MSCCPSGDASVVVLIKTPGAESGKDWARVKHLLAPNDPEWEGDKQVAGTSPGGVLVNFLTFETPDVAKFLPPSRTIVAVPKPVWSGGTRASRAEGSCLVWETDLEVSAEHPREFISAILAEIMTQHT